MQVIACYEQDIMQIWKMGRKKLKFTRIEKNGQCLNECMKLCLQNNQFDSLPANRFKHEENVDKEMRLLKDSTT